MLDTFRPLLEAAKGLDLSDPARAVAELRRRFDPNGPGANALHQQLLALLESGQIAQRGALPVCYGRVSKAVDETGDFSIDVVHMNGAGPLHTHPAGEVNYLLPLEGKPTFENTAAGWVVMAPGSKHVPAVQGGRMLIVYLLPKGQIEFAA